MGRMSAIPLNLGCLDKSMIGGGSWGPSGVQGKPWSGGFVA